MKKVLSMLLSLVMLLSLLNVGVAVSAATPDSQVIDTYAGETIKIKFIEDNCYGVSGYIEYSNDNLFSSVTPGGSTAYGKITEKAFNLSSADKTTCEVILTVVISDNAKVGDTCTVSFTGCELVENNEDYSGRSDYTKSVTVKVGKKPTTTTKKTTTKKTTTTTKKVTTKKTTTATKKVTTTTKKPTTKKPTTTEAKAPGKTTTAKAPGKTTTASSIITTTGTKAPVANLDLTELNKQIGIAQSLDESLYTSDSWAQLESALKAAIKARGASTQNEVNKAADALRAAIDALVKVDADALQQLIDDVNSFLEDNDLASVWEELHSALDEAKQALESGDQDAIDAAYARLEAAFKALKEKLNEIGKGEVVIQEVEVQGECGEKCHVWWHWLLLILFIISAILNIGFIVLVVLYYIKKKKNTVDNTPVVDYDINDDMV